MAYCYAGFVVSSLKEYFHYGCAALRVATDIETPIVFHCFYIYCNAQRSAALVETGLNGDRNHRRTHCAKARRNG